MRKHKYQSYPLRIYSSAFTSLIKSFSQTLPPALTEHWNNDVQREVTVHDYEVNDVLYCRWALWRVNSRRTAYWFQEAALVLVMTFKWQRLLWVQKLSHLGDKFFGFNLASCSCCWQWFPFSRPLKPCPQRSVHLMTLFIWSSSNSEQVPVQNTDFSSTLYLNHHHTGWKCNLKPLLLIQLKLGLKSSLCVLQHHM